MTPGRPPPDGRTAAERALDDALAARVREAFAALDAPATDAGWARVHAALAAAGAPAADRPAARRAASVRRAGVLVAVSLAAAGVGWLAAARLGAPPAAPETARVAATPPAAPLAATPLAAAPLVATPLGDALGLASPDDAPGLVLPTDPAPARPADIHPAPGTAPPSRRPLDAAPSPPRGGGQGEGSAPPREAVAHKADAPPADPRPAGPPVFVASALPSARPVGLPPRAAPRVRVFATASAGPVVLGDAAGLGASVGVAAEWALGRGVRVGGGPRLAALRVEASADPAFVATVFNTPASDLDGVTLSESATALAVEVPVEVAVDVGRVRGRRVTAAAGLVSAVYLAQRFTAESVRVQAAADGTLSATALGARESVGPLGRVDVARQASVSVGVAGPRVGAEVFGRLPLGGATSRAERLSQVGVRLRVALD